MRLPDVKRLAKAARQECDRFCEDWIGWSLPPVARIIEDAKWSPAGRDSYCRRCGQQVGEGEATATGCGACRTTPMPIDAIVKLGSYSEHLRQWILRIKYGRWNEMARRLGRDLGVAVRESGEVELAKAVVSPMPMPWLRRAYRGIDHAGVIAGAVARELDAPLVRLLAKANGPTQLGVPKTGRRINARQGKRIRKRWGGWPVEGLHVILVDDVRTTGSSLNAAARLIRPLGCEKIVAAVVAVAESGRREVKAGLSSSEEVL